MASHSTTEVTLVAGRGLDALEGYFAKYLPQLVLTVLATPALVAVIFSQDVTSGVIVLVTLPLIPLFMVLVGWATQAAQNRQWSALSVLSGGFLDVVNGLTTLKLYGRQHRQEQHIRSVSDEYRVHTMRVLRMSFLSGFVLELAASLSVALVAVAIGLRLLNGQLDLAVGLFVLLLAPEAFLPLRNVGAGFHAAAEGVAAAENAFVILDAAAELPARAEAAAAAPRDAEPTAPAEGASLSFDGVTIQRDGRRVVDDCCAVVRPGTFCVLSSPSGTGKSTLLSAVLGFTPFRGTIAVGTVEDAESRRAAVAWAGQTPGLLAGTIASNVALGAHEADEALVAWSLATAAAGDLAPTTTVGVGGAGLSGGEAQRVAVARALYRLKTHRCSVLLLDEPTSALDSATEARLIASLHAVARSGVAVLVVSHRDALVRCADEVIRMEATAHVR